MRMIDPAYYFGTKEQIVEYILPPMAECLVHNHGGLWYLQIKSGFSEGLSVALDEYRQDGFKKAWDGLQSKVSKHFTIMFMLLFNLNIFAWNLYQTCHVLTVNVLSNWQVNCETIEGHKWLTELFVL